MSTPPHMLVLVITGGILAGFGAADHAWAQPPGGPPKGPTGLTLSFGANETRPAALNETPAPPTSTTASAAQDDATPLTLNDLIRLAVRDSFQVRVSAAQIGEAKALYGIAISLAYPQGSAQFLFGGPTSEARTAVQNEITTLTDASFEGDFNLGDLGVSLRGAAEVAVPLMTFGKIRRGKQAASHLVSASKHQLEATRSSVVLDLVRAFWGWQLLRNLISSLEEGEIRLDNVLEQIDQLLDADSGQVTENDRLRLKFAVSTLTVRRAQAEGGLTQLEQAIRLLIGRRQHQPLAIAEARLEEAVVKDLPAIDTLISAARLERQELKALRDVVKAQKAFRQLREAQMLPTVFFGGFLNFALTTNATDQTNPFINDPFNFFTAGVGLGVQLDLDFFTKLAQVEQAQAQVNVRSQQELLAIEASELQVRSLHAQIRAELEQMRRLERANLSARGWLTASTLAYDIGAGQADELIDAFLAWATSIAELQSTRYDSIIHFAELARATGRLLQQRP